MFYTKGLLLILALFLQTSCVLTKSEIKLTNINRQKPSVKAVSFADNQIKVTGSGLSKITSLKLKNNNSDEKFSIESVSSSQIIAKSTRAISITLDQAFELILSNAQGEATFPIAFTLDTGELVASSIEVSGEIKLGNSSTACSASNEGAQRYNSTSKVMEFCNGTSWGSFSATTTTNPVATVISTASATLPTGYLLCDGSAVSRTTYSDLFAAIGTTYGAGDGSTTFNLPDLRGRSVIGAGQGTALTNRTLGSSGGTELVNGDVSVDISVSTGVDGAITASNGSILSSSLAGPSSASIYAAAATAPVLLGGVTTTTDGFNGGDGTDANMQPFTVLRFVIKY